MAYSRWSGSDWYVFWLAGSEPTQLCMWLAGDESMPSATFAQLDGITEDGLALLVPRAPRDSLSELMEYVQEFCADVRDQQSGKEPSRW